MTSAITILGDHPFTKRPDGKLRSRIASIFPQDRALVTLPGIHATQRVAFVDHVKRQRTEAGLPPPTPEHEHAAYHAAVDLVVEDGAILIRPDPENMPLAFKADDLLQEFIPKHRIQFLHVLDQRVRGAIKRRGECWRITPFPRTPHEMAQMIAASRAAIGGEEIYYFNKGSGERLVTCQQFAELPALGAEGLRRHLLEIAEYSARCNAHGNPEVRFFMAGPGFSREDFAGRDFAALGEAELAAAHAELARRFCEATPPQFRRDDPEDHDWRGRMFAALICDGRETVSEETLLGLASEFFMQIEWLPGGRIEGGELIFDSVFDQKIDGHEDLAQLLDEKPRKFIINYVREYGDLEYVNIGRVIGSLSRRPAFYGRRDVYIAQLKQHDSPQEIVKIIRMQKWAVREHLDEGKGLLEAMIRSEEYTDFILNRRLGCQQLGMNLPLRAAAKKLSEHYATSPEGHGFLIWSPYFERDYIRGVATDKLPPCKLHNAAYALRLAWLLGRAAAPNMIVGRSDQGGNVLFDDGDEVVIEDETGMPLEIVVADQTGTFAEYLQDLSAVAADYAAPINCRLDDLGCAAEFARTYLDAFADRFAVLQQEYRQRKRGFDTLFTHQPRDPAGNFAFRWEKVLERLARTDVPRLREAIRRHIKL